MLVGAAVITVVSTAYAAPTEHICRASVRSQNEPAEHVYIDASKQPVAMPATWNLFHAINALPPDRIVVWLDGDDWLAPDALWRVDEMYSALDPLLTYGQYIHTDGRPGHCGPYDWTKPVREQPWLASHLKTFRAGLFHHLTPEDLQIDGEWIALAVDMAVMLPMLELAGPSRVHFNPRPLMVYNRASSFEAHATRSDLEREAMTEMLIRSKPRKDVLP